MKKRAKNAGSGARRKARTRQKLVTWTLVLAVLGVVGYGIANFSNVAYDEKDIKVVGFDGLNAKQKRAALESANTTRCGCGCGMTLAQCVSTDMTCPVRDGNIEKIRTMVREALSTS